MARPRKNKPKSPTEIAAEKIAERKRNFGAVGMQPEAAALQAFDDVLVEREVRQSAEQRGNVDRARRQDVFDFLRNGMEPGTYDSIRRLQADMAVRRGEGDRGRSMERVDGSAGRGTTDAMLLAGEAVDYVMSRIGKRSQWLLSELLDPTPEAKIARPTWRLTVAYITGEENDRAQNAAVRMVSLDVLDAYKEFDETRPRRKAAA